MGRTVKRKTCWLLRAELVAIVFLACFSVLRPIIANSDSAKTGFLGKILRSSQDKAPSEDGTITAIVYNEHNPSVIIGSRTIAREADVIDGVTIVKIHKGKVEFEKEGQSWTRKIGERPRVTAP
jgi:hypothetical protein